MLNTSRSSRAPISSTGSPIAGYSETPRWKRASARSVFLDLADQIDMRDRLVAVLARQRLDGDVGDHADQERFPGADAQELADGGAGVVGSVGRYGRQPNARLRAAHRNDVAERLAGGMRRARRNPELINLQSQPP